ncbi:hypothetical protein [Arthrobacter sp. CAN_C5]|nr:hypothetical protein [Arthrobacter sp. CAN_C5]MBP2218524.1 hypothetical protein [Arthrobacter sp. CAN_C5]
MSRHIDEHSSVVNVNGASLSIQNLYLLWLIENGGWCRARNLPGPGLA